MLWNYLNNFDNMLHVNFDILLGCFFVTCVWLQFAEQTNPCGGVKYEIFIDIWAIKLFTWNCVIITLLLFCKPICHITHRTNRGESWYTSSPVSMPNVHFITFDWQNQQCCFVCLLVSRWKAQLVRRCTVFELSVFFTMFVSYNDLSLLIKEKISIYSIKHSCFLFYKKRMSCAHG